MNKSDKVIYYKSAAPIDKSFQEKIRQNCKLEILDNLSELVLEMYSEDLIFIFIDLRAERDHGLEKLNSMRKFKYLTSIPQIAICEPQNSQSLILCAKYKIDVITESLHEFDIIEKRCKKIYDKFHDT